MTNTGYMETGQTAQMMIDALAQFSSDPERLIRLYLSPEHRLAANCVHDWMEKSGLETFEDALGTVYGRRLAGTSGPNSHKTLFVGSHIDTVIDAGRYDGNFGVVAAILALTELQNKNIDLPFSVEILAFGDEEGSRFPSSYSSSSAIAGHFNPAELDMFDANQISFQQALELYGKSVDDIAAIARNPGDILGYLEVHIEQGPVLEHNDISLGTVTSIAGQSRHVIRIGGEAGHAGTVPMSLRKDALLGAAEMMIAIERIAKMGREYFCVATVGQIQVNPGASNIIPNAVSFSLDLRACSDPPRLSSLAEIERISGEISARRGLSFSIETYHETPTIKCSQTFQNAIGNGITDTGEKSLSLTSGGGHDGQAMAQLTEIGMLFVRSRGGISHNPAEFVAIEDMGRAVAALEHTLIDLANRFG
ncbi:MAG: Zn-dependent hydrolase [Hyphomicrobiales bacterium]|nr:MAG: Zn-dependent hydrolase [Hyphomicrobiales bacterium]